MVKRKTQLPSPFCCSPHPFKGISHHTNLSRLLWPLTFIVFILQHNSCAYYTPPCNSARESSYFIFKSRTAICLQNPREDNSIKYRVFLLQCLSSTLNKWFTVGLTLSRSFHLFKSIQCSIFILQENIEIPLVLYTQ